MGDGNRKLSHLFHAERKRSEPAISRFAQTNVKECFVSSFHGGFGGQAGKLSHHTGEANRGHVGDKCVGFGHVTDLMSNLSGLCSDIEAKNTSCSARGQVKP